MGDRKRRGVAPRLEPMERRDLLSGLLVALHPTNVPYLNPAQVASIATTRAHTPGTVSARAGTGGTGGGAGGTSGGNAGSSSGSLTESAGGGLYNGGNNPQGIAFNPSPLLGTGTPTTAELARETFHAKFYGPLSVLPPRFSDQSRILLLKGLGDSTPNFFLHGDYALAMVFPAGFDSRNPAGTGGDPAAAGYVPPVTGFAFLDDKNNNSGGVVGLDLVADPTSFDAKGRPTRLSFTANPNIYGGAFAVNAAVGTVTISYRKNTAQSVFDGRIYTSGLTSPFENVDLYRRGGRLTARG
jgi:hypothetical protein